MTIKRLKPFIPKTNYEKFIMLCLCPTSLTVLAAGVVSRTIYWGKHFQFKVCAIAFLAKKSIMTALRPASIRIYNQHMEHKSYCLEPLFNEHKYLTLKTFILTTCSWRCFRFSAHFMFFETAIQSMPKKSKFFSYDKKVKLGVSKQNVVFKATKIWNKLIGHALERNDLSAS